MKKKPGCARVSEIATHWNVYDSTAREIIATAGLVPVDAEGWKKYFWEDIWRLEGDLFVPQNAWRAFKEPLLKTPSLPERDPIGRSPRTMQRYIEQGKIPCIRLAPDIIRVRECIFDVVIHRI
ncbi:hypothetical protein [Pararhodobacter sp. SW119]|uniref:hypothetical protein n=1 Tax=Pararhodobacter sp. SW119 TaxID=2780075 RepID=UPI001ADF8B3F|nr:hypothetical protein [Pararhodobacter sp. SW119]